MKITIIDINNIEDLVLAKTILCKDIDPKPSLQEFLSQHINLSDHTYMKKDEDDTQTYIIPFSYKIKDDTCYLFIYNEPNTNTYIDEVKVLLEKHKYALDTLPILKQSDLNDLMMKDGYVLLLNNQSYIQI